MQPSPNYPEEHQDLCYSICVSGAASGKTVEQDKILAARLGAAIARRGHITTTGATIGLPFYAAKGAKSEGGMSIGFSPASGIRDHMRRYRLPRNYFDYINYTGMNYVGRDAYLIQSSDAVITVGGRFGSLHEFVTAVEMHKPCGILTGSEGTADVIPELVKVLELPHKHKIIFDDNPENLVNRIVAILDDSYSDVYKELERNEHWFLDDSNSRSG
jgi:uncharacterized protein (TIGR00725 family)